METKNPWRAWLYLAPALLLLAVFTFYPLLNTIFISFLKNYDYRSGAFDGFTFDNYGIVLGITEVVPGIPESRVDEFIKYALPNTFILTFITCPIAVILSLFIALLLNNIKFFRNIFQTIFFLPYITNVIAVGMVFNVIFSDYGIFNTLLGLAGKVQWISLGASRANSLFILCIYIVWMVSPYKILIFSSGLQNINKQYYDAAKVDGTGKVKTAFKITIPLLGPQILYVTIISFIGAFKEYNTLVGLFNRNYTSSGNTHDLNTVVYYIYSQLEGTNPKMHIAAAGAVILFLIIMIFTLIELKISKDKVHY